ncbi:MAG: hypothetical protein IPG93_18955 [Burkholderiales bacterium]|nr:hypothetical protein [Burkholderiales bacterium]
MDFTHMAHRVQVLCFVVVAGVLQSLPGLALADFPARLSTIDVGARVDQIRSSADGSRVVLLVQANKLRPAGIQLLDLSNPRSPKMRAFMPIAASNVEVSSDGRRALVYSGREAKFKDANPFVITELDFADPDRPKEFRRRELMATQVVLAPDASAYTVVSQLARDPERWGTTVTWLDGSRLPVKLKIDDHPKLVRNVSVGARYILYGNYSGAFVVVNTTATPSVEYQQSYSPGRDLGCGPYIDGSGHTLVPDPFASRFSVYAFRAALPRVAMIDHAGGPAFCTDLQSLDGDWIYFVDTANRLYRLDPHDTVRSAVAFVRHLPIELGSTRVAGELLFAAISPSSSTLGIFSLTSTEPVVLDWTALERAHRQVMEAYTKDIRNPARRFSAEYHSPLLLQEAGMGLAVDAPLLGFSPRKVAAMLNDFGFLLSKQANSEGLAERVLRRSLELDPSRALAMLNLADLLASTLPHETDFAVKHRRAQEAEALYGSYMALTGGKSTKRLEAFMKAAPARNKADNICDAIADYTRAGILHELMTEKAVGIKAGDRKVDLKFGYEGTATVPYMYAFDALDDSDLTDFDSILGERRFWGGDKLALVVYRDSYHVLHYRDLSHPVESIALDDGHSCSFDTSVREVIGPRSIDPELCAALQADSQINSIAFDPARPVDRESIRRRYVETGSDGVADIDFQNNQEPIPLVSLAIRSGGGRGCDADVYDVLDSSERHARLASGPMHHAIMQLQGLDPDERKFVPPCGNSVRLFKYGGRMHFESKPRVWPPEDSATEYHRVTRFENGKVREVCDFKFESQVVAR